MNHPNSADKNNQLPHGPSSSQHDTTTSQQDATTVDQIDQVGDRAPRDVDSQTANSSVIDGPSVGHGEGRALVPPQSTEPSSTTGQRADQSALIARQKERFGGIKVGSAFFGWLTATGMSVLLITLLAAGGVAFGVATDGSVSVDQAVAESQQATGTARTVGLVGAITLLVVLLVAYYCGGYVAGRMARFNGAKQGFAVWLWGLLMALIIAAVAAIAGAQYDVFAQLNLPRLPVNEGQVTAVGAIAIAVAVLAALIGAVLGGLAGMRFHRKVDKTEIE